MCQGYGRKAPGSGRYGSAYEWTWFDSCHNLCWRTKLPVIIIANDAIPDQFKIMTIVDVPFTQHCVASFSSVLFSRNAAFQYTAGILIYRSPMLNEQQLLSAVFDNLQLAMGLNC